MAFCKHKWADPYCDSLYDNDNKNEEKEEYKGNSRIYKDESRREALDEYLAGYKGDSKPKGKHF